MVGREGTKRDIQRERLAAADSTSQLPDSNTHDKGRLLAAAASSTAVGVPKLLVGGFNQRGALPQTAATHS